MWKKLLSLNLVLLLLLTLLPAGALAADGTLKDSSGRTELRVRYAQRESWILYTSEKELISETDFAVSADQGRAEVTGSTVTFESDGLRPGETGTITATRLSGDGESYTIPFTVIMPYVGWYSKPEYDEKNLLEAWGSNKSFFYTGADGVRKVYLMVTNGDRPVTIEEQSGSEEITAEMMNGVVEGKDSTILSFTFSDAVTAGTYTKTVRAATAYDRAVTWTVTFTAGLALKTSGNKTMIEVPLSAKQGDWFSLCTMKDEPVTSDTFTISSDKGRADLSGDNVWVSIEGMNVGDTGTITATRLSDPDDRYTIPFTVTLPTYGWYSEPVLDGEKLLTAASPGGKEGNTFFYTGADGVRTVYLLLSRNSGDWPTELVSESGSGEITAELKDGGDALWGNRVLTLTLDAGVTAGNYAKTVTTRNGYGGTSTWTVTFADGKTLKAQNGSTALEVAAGSRGSWRLTTAKGEAVTEDAFSLSSDVGSVSFGGTWVYLDASALHVGDTGTITATRLSDPDEQYTIPFTVTLPYWGWYGEPVLDGENLLAAAISGGGNGGNLFLYTGADGVRTVYLLLSRNSGDWPTEILSESGSGEITAEMKDGGDALWGNRVLTLTLDAGATAGTYAKTVTTRAINGWERTWTVTFTDGSAAFGNGMATSLVVKARSSDFFKLYDITGEALWRDEWPELIVSPGMGVAYWGAGQIVWDASSVAPNKTGTLTLRAEDGRELTIGLQTVLPEYGYFAAPEKTAEQYLGLYASEWDYTEETGRTLYYFAVGPGTSGNLTLYEAASDDPRVNVSVEAEGACMKIELDGSVSAETVQATIHYKGESQKWKNAGRSDYVFEDDRTLTFRPAPVVKSSGGFTVQTAPPETPGQTPPATVTVPVTLTNDAAAPVTANVLAAVYENGRFLALKLLENVELQPGVPFEQTLEVQLLSGYDDPAAMSVKLYLVEDGSYRPLTTAALVTAAP